MFTACKSPPDGSCYFHSILRAVNKDYSERDYPQKKEYVALFRSCLANILPLQYDRLSAGQLAAYSKYVEGYNLVDLQLELINYSAQVDIVYHELISNALHIDIYIFDEKTSDPHLLADPGLLHLGRRSIVLLYSSGHYDTLTYQGRSVFEPDEDIIQRIRNRQNSLRRD